MSQQRKLLIVSLATILSLITILLLPTIINVATSYLNSLYPGVDTWIKEHIMLIWLAIIIVGLLAAILGAILINLQLPRVSNALPPDNSLDISIDRVNEAVDIASKDPMLNNQSHPFSVLIKWKQLTEELINDYNNYIKLNDKDSKQVATDIVGQIERLLKHTRKSFIYLNRMTDFTETTMSAYAILYKHARWRYAADMIYDIGRVRYELGKYGRYNRSSWIEYLRTCLDKAKSSHLSSEWNEYLFKYMMQITLKH